MRFSPHRPRLRGPAYVGYEFDRSRLPPGYFLYSDFGSARLEERVRKAAITTSGTVPFGASAASAGINWAGGGSTSRIDYATFAIPAQFTMEALVQIGTVQDEMVLAFINNNGADTGTTDRQLAIRSTGVFSFCVFTSTSEYTTGTTVFAPGSIVHVAVTYDGTTYRLYTNGALDGSAALAAGYGGYTNPVLCAGFQSVTVLPGHVTSNQSTHTLLLAAMADRALLDGEVWQRSQAPWAPLLAPRISYAASLSPITGAAAITFANMTAAGTGALAIKGAAGITFGDMTVAGANTTATTVHGIIRRRHRGRTWDDVPMELEPVVALAENYADALAVQRAVDDMLARYARLTMRTNIARRERLVEELKQAVLAAVERAAEDDDEEALTALL